MKWRISFSNDSLRFLIRNKVGEDAVTNLIERALQKFKGEQVNVDIKKLEGKWEGFYRIRSGKLRIVAEFRFEHYQVYIERIDWRGNIYK